MSLPYFDKRLGEVYFREFDQGFVETMGGVVRDGPEGRQYFVDIEQRRYPNKDPEAIISVPIYWTKPEQSLYPQFLPCFSISREAVVDNARYQSVGHFDYVVGVEGTEIGNTGAFSKQERRTQSWPFSIIYNLSCFSRYEYESYMLLRHMQRIWKPYSVLFLTDSIGDRRSYSCFLESGPNDISELVDVSDRTKGYSISLRVEGELDLTDPVIVDCVTGIVQNIDINLGPLG